MAVWEHYNQKKKRSITQVAYDTSINNFIVYP